MYDEAKAPELARNHYESALKLSRFAEYDFSVSFLRIKQTRFGLEEKQKAAMEFEKAGFYV